MPYDVLGIDRGADKATVKKAYLKKVKEFPPDKFPEEFKKIKKAYDALKKGRKQSMHSLTPTVEAFEVTENDLREIREAVTPKLTIDEMIRLTF